MKLVAAGGGSQVWSILSGALPTGLSLAKDGTLSGTPTAATPDPATFVVKVTDDARTDTKPFALDVVTPLAATPATLPGGGGRARLELRRRLQPPADGRLTRGL